MATVGVGLPHGGLGAASRLSPDVRLLVFILVLGVVAFLVIYPLSLLLVASFEVGPYGQATTIGLGNWQVALTDPRLQSAIVNTLTLTVTRQGIAFVVGVVLAFLLARTNLPGRHWLEFGFWIAFFVPTLPVLLGWIFLLDGHSGLINRLVKDLGWLDGPLFEIYSWWGIVFVHLMTNTVIVKVMLLTPAFRNLDASLVEMARVSGAGATRTLIRVVIPVLAPAILAVVLLGTIRSLEAFEIELILGAPQQIDVYSTAIYHRVFDSPPDYGPACALSIMVFALIAPLVLGQQMIARRRSRASISARFSAAVTDLGRWRWPAFAMFVVLLLTMTALPMSFMLIGSFMEFFGYFDVPGGAFTLRHWTTVLGDPVFLDALWDTFVIATSAALVAMLLFPAVAYLIVRTRYLGRGLLDFLTWVPTTLPGIVVGLAFLWMFLETPVLRPVYGTEIGLILAFTLAGMALGVQLIKAGIMQISLELEEAARVGGAAWLLTMRRVVVPLVAPTVVVVGVLAFVTATRAVSTPVLLSSRATQTLSVFQLKFIEAGDLEAASVVGVVVLVMSTGVALVARTFGLRFGLGSR